MPKLPFHAEIYCTDGFHMSVQASPHHLCRRVGGRYTAYEVGYPSPHDEALEPYRMPDYGYGLTNVNVFEYVPTDVIQDIIDRHGGLAPYSGSFPF